MGKIVQIPTRRRGPHDRPVHECVTELNNIALMRGAKYQHVATGIIEMKRAIPAISLPSGAAR